MTAARVRHLLPVLATIVVGAWLTASRRSKVVRCWRPPSGEPERLGRIWARDVEPAGGAADRSILLLHGLGASSDYFGDWPDRLARDGRVVVPDLVGFGRSRHVESDYSMDAHATSIVELVDSAATTPLVIAAHSMGCGLALEVARRTTRHVERVVVFGPPMYPSPDEFVEGARYQEPVIRFAVSGNRIAPMIARLNESHPVPMGWMWAALSPTIPAGISRWASRNTRSSLEGSLRALVLEVDWGAAIDVGVPVVVVRGRNDRIGNRDFVCRLIRETSTAVVHEVDDAGHHVPITHSRVARAALLGRLDPPGADAPGEESC